MSSNTSPEDEDDSKRKMNVKEFRLVQAEEGNFLVQHPNRGQHDESDGSLGYLSWVIFGALVFFLVIFARRLFGSLSDYQSQKEDKKPQQSNRARVEIWIAFLILIYFAVEIITRYSTSKHTRKRSEFVHQMSTTTVQLSDTLTASILPDLIEIHCSGSECWYLEHLLRDHSLIELASKESRQSSQSHMIGPFRFKAQNLRSLIHFLQQDPHAKFIRFYASDTSLERLQNFLLRQKIERIQSTLNDNSEVRWVKPLMEFKRQSVEIPLSDGNVETICGNVIDPSTDQDKVIFQTNITYTLCTTGEPCW